jgi:hypothetical protein
MQKIFSVFILLAFTVFSTYAQEKGKVVSPRAYVKTANLSISYGQPSKRGREIFGGLVPYGQVWRTGANEATEITFKKQCNFGEHTVKAGTYTLFTIPNENEWTIILNGQLKQWGAFDYAKYKDKDVVQFTVPVKHLESSVEKFTISAAGNNMIMQWDKTSVSVPMKF